MEREHIMSGEIDRRVNRKLTFSSAAVCVGAEDDPAGYEGRPSIMSSSGGGALAATAPGLCAASCTLSCSLRLASSSSFSSRADL